MAHIVFAWELGGGYGHVGRFRPVAEQLIMAGHEVTLIVKDLQRTSRLFSSLDVRLFQAPVKVSRALPYNPTPVTFVHLLLNIGYQDAQELGAMVGAWHNLLEATRPDVMVFDHSPTAMIAARGIGVPKLTIGTGFCCPPDLFPLPAMAPWRSMSEAERQRDEMIVVERINSVLAGFSMSRIERVGQLYSEVDRNLLTTFPELDHYPQRSGGTYLGTWAAIDTRNSTGGHKPTEEVDWPTGNGPKIYAYLKPSKAVPDLLRWVGGQGLPLVAVCDGLDTTELSRNSSRNVRLYSRPLPMDALSRWCDLAILNGNHGTSCELLLAGRPQLHLPLTFEQSILARRIEELGAGLTAAPDQARQVITQLGSLMNSQERRRSALELQERMRGHGFAESNQACVRHILELL